MIFIYINTLYGACVCVYIYIYIHIYIYMHYANLTLNVLCRELFPPGPVPSVLSFVGRPITTNHIELVVGTERLPTKKPWCLWGGGGSRNLTHQYGSCMTLRFGFYMHYAYANLMLNVLCRELFQPEPVPSVLSFVGPITTNRIELVVGTERLPNKKPWCLIILPSMRPNLAYSG